jgi:radical SAM additional 4Fe4S-binding domain
VTNGYNILNYIDIFKSGQIREIQVTLDGTAEVHNNRRFLRDKSATFQQISDGVDALLANYIPVNLRMVIDRENIKNLPDLALYARNKGWTSSAYFKTQLGRNYELHHCQKANMKLYSRLELYQDLYDLIKNHPEILDFHKPAFSISKFLFERGELPDPLFDACPACKTEWAFDYTGTIYPCTATVGKSEERLGTYYPSISMDNKKVCDWEERDVLSIKECVNCSLQLACGGGCGSVAKNLHGYVQAPDCRPVKDLMRLGISLYQNL